MTVAELNTKIRDFKYQKAIEHRNKQKAEKLKAEIEEKMKEFLTMIRI